MTTTVTMTQTRCAGGATFHTAGQNYDLDDGLARHYIQNNWATYVSGGESFDVTVKGVGVANIINLSQAEYDAIAVKDDATLYVIV